jgi:hypothetical protein
MLTKSNTPFYGIVPGNAAIPLGSVVLPVTFGESRDNYRTEYIKFEVADFETSYHAQWTRPIRPSGQSLQNLPELYDTGVDGF